MRYKLLSVVLVLLIILPGVLFAQGDSSPPTEAEELTSIEVSPTDDTATPTSSESDGAQTPTAPAPPASELPAVPIEIENNDLDWPLAHRDYRNHKLTVLQHRLV